MGLNQEQDLCSDGLSEIRAQLCCHVKQQQRLAAIRRKRLSSNLHNGEIRGVIECDFFAAGFVVLRFERNCIEFCVIIYLLSLVAAFGCLFWVNTNFMSLWHTRLCLQPRVLW